MRILIDTNVLISGLFFHGLPNKLWAEFDFEKFNVCVNEELRGKFFSNLHKFEKVSDLKL